MTQITRKIFFGLNFIRYFFFMVANFQKKQKRNPFKNMLLTAGALLLFLAIVLLVVANIKIYQKRKQFVEQIAGLQNRVEELQSRNQELEEGIEKTGDDAYVEKVAREELNMQQPGEKVVSFVKEESQEVENQEEKKGFWSWWESFGNMFN